MIIKEEIFFDEKRNCEEYWKNNHCYKKCYYNKNGNKEIDVLINKKLHEKWIFYNDSGEIIFEEKHIIGLGIINRVVYGYENGRKYKKIYHPCNGTMICKYLKYI